MTRHFSQCIIFDNVETESNPDKSQINLCRANNVVFDDQVNSFIGALLGRVYESAHDFALYSLLHFDLLEEFENAVE